MSGLVALGLVYYALHGHRCTECRQANMDTACAETCAETCIPDWPNIAFGLHQLDYLGLDVTNGLTTDMVNAVWKRNPRITNPLGLCTLEDSFCVSTWMEPQS